MKVFIIPDNLIFSPCKVDGLFWTQFHNLISYLGEPERLIELKKESEKDYYSLIEPLIRFVSETESELHSKGHLIEHDPDQVGSS